MAVVIVRETISDQDLALAKEDLGDYIKVVVDIKKGIVAAGGNLHSDEEKMLLEKGSQQVNLWGGGVDLVSGEFDCLSLINARSNDGNPSQDILDPEIRKKVLMILGKFFPKEVVINEQS